MFFAYGIKKLANAQAQASDSINRTLISDTAKYALLYIYRPNVYQGAIIGYKIHLGKDSIICRAKNNSKYIVKLYEEGPTDIWGATESRSTVSPDIKFGHTYFIRCAIKMGAFVGEPSLTLMDTYKGLSEFNDINFKPKKDDKDSAN